MAGQWQVTILTGVLALGCGRPAAPPALTTVDAVQLRAAVATPGTAAVLVNMWATWCIPCREEFPDLVKLEKTYRDRGLRVVLVSWDAEATTAQPFLRRQGVTFPSYIKTGHQGDPRFIEQFEPRWSGAFPATMIYDASGRLRHFWEGKRSYAEFEKHVLDVLNPNQNGGTP